MLYCKKKTEALKQSNIRISQRVESAQSSQEDLEKSALLLYDAQVLLYEERSKLDNLIVSLSAMAGDKWQTCRDMVIRWDRKLYD